MAPTQPRCGLRTQRTHGRDLPPGERQTWGPKPRGAIRVCRPPGAHTRVGCSGRMRTPVRWEEVADTCVFLKSPRSTGSWGHASQLGDGELSRGLTGLEVTAHAGPASGSAEPVPPPPAPPSLHASGVVSFWVRPPVTSALAHHPGRAPLAPQETPAIRNGLGPRARKQGSPPDFTDCSPKSSFLKWAVLKGVTLCRTPAETTVREAGGRGESQGHGVGLTFTAIPGRGDVKGGTESRGPRRPGPPPAGSLAEPARTATGSPRCGG